MPLIRHNNEVVANLASIGDVESGTPDDNDVLIYNSGLGAYEVKPPYFTVRRQTLLIDWQNVQAGPVGVWVPLNFVSDVFGVFNGHDWVNPATPQAIATTVHASWTPVALPTTHIDVVDATGFDTTSANKYLSIAIPGSAVTTVRYSSISLGAGISGSDRVNLSTANGTGVGHRGVGTPAAGAVVKQGLVEIYAPSAEQSSVAQILLATGSLEAISGGVVKWRFRGASASSFYTASSGVVNLSSNVAEETAQVAYLGTVNPRDAGWFLEFFSSVAGGTASQVRTDPFGFLGPGVTYADFGETLS